MRETFSLLFGRRSDTSGIFIVRLGSLRIPKGITLRAAQCYNGVLRWEPVRSDPGTLFCELLLGLQIHGGWASSTRLEK